MREKQLVCNICERIFKTKKEFVEHLKEHRRNEKVIWLLAKDTKMPLVFLTLLKHPGLTAYELAKKLGFPISDSSYLKIMEKEGLVIRKEGKSKGLRILKRNYPNIGLVANFILNNYISEKSKPLINLFVEILERNYDLIFSEKFFQMLPENFEQYSLLFKEQIKEGEWEKIYPTLKKYLIDLFYFFTLSEKEEIKNYSSLAKLKKFIDFFELPTYKKYFEKRVKEIKERIDESIKVFGELKVEFIKLKQLLEKEDFEGFEKKVKEIENKLWKGNVCL